MRTILVYIILLFTLMFSQALSPAYSTAGENKHYSSAHDILLCLDCHSHITENQDHPSIEGSNESCMECHEISSGFSFGSHEKVICLNCHSRHHEKVTNDAHINVSCRACHLSEIKPVREKEDNIHVWRYEQVTAGEYNPHKLISEKEDICSRCHFTGNSLGVSDHALPAKSFICMPCHAATFSIGDIPSAFAIMIFLIGLLSIIFVWISAGKSHRKEKRCESCFLLNLIKGLIFDGIFQRRLLKVSVKRWIIHGMIFFPFLIRFFWGITALVSSLFIPERDITWMMLDKNNPVTGLVFDITGLMILTGGCMIVFQKRADRKLLNIKNLPKGNVLVNALLGSIIITGFIVEGARIAMTGSPEGSHYAFIGYMISKTLSGYHLSGLYAYLWYLHAVLTALFIACLPFSRMFHIFTAPLSLFLRGEYGD